MARKKRKPRFSPVCRWVDLAQDRQTRDLRDGKKRGLWWDEEAAQHAVNFIERHCKHWEGLFAGKPFILSGWQRDDVVRPIFGWKILPPGITPKKAAAMTRWERIGAGIFRRFRTAFIEVPRKNGKTMLASAIALYLLIADGEAGAQVFSAATKKDQARIVFKNAKQILRKAPDLADLVKINVGSIEVPSLASVLEPLSSEENSLDGLNIHGCIIDEVHAHKTRVVIDVLSTASGSRSQPIVLMITTAGEMAKGPGWQEHDLAEKILDRVVELDTHFAYIVAADPDDKARWDDPRVWAKSNPNLGISASLESIQSAAARAKASPSFLNAFMRYHLNIWVDAAECFFDMDRWRECGDAKFPESELEGRTCYAGLDLSRKIDLTACVLVFPPTEADEYWRILPHFWVPLERIPARSKEDRVPYDVWHSGAFLTATPGWNVDYSFILDYIVKAARRFDIQALGYDSYNASNFIENLLDQGFSEEWAVEVRQGYVSLSEPMKEIESLVASNGLRHDDNPVMTWCASNCVARLDANENVAPDKKKSRERIDGVSALVTAMRAAMAGVQGVYSYSGM